MKKILLVILLLFCFINYSFCQFNILKLNGNVLKYGDSILYKSFNVMELQPTLWLNGSSVVKDGSNYVSQWNDLSGNENHAVQATGANQPLLVNNSLNNKPVIRFDGSNDYLSGNINLTTDKLTIFIVCKPLKESNSTSALSLYNSYDAADYTTKNSLIVFAQGWWNYPSNCIGAYRGGSGGVNYIYNYINTPEIYTLIASGNFLKTYLNGTSVNNLSSSGNFNIDKCHIGSRFFSNIPQYFMNIDIAEIIVFKKELTEAERINVERYLNTKYNIY